MNYKRIVILLIFQQLLGDVVLGQNNIATEGLFHKYSKWFIDSFEVNRLWFKDSAIIYELKVDVEYGEDTIVKYRGYEPYRYSYFDMRTRMFYDYNSFTDTATLIIKYAYEEGYMPTGFFHALNPPKLNSPEIISDTFMHGKKLKRIKVTDKRSSGTQGFVQIYYYDCLAYLSDIMSVYKIGETYFPHCSLHQVDAISYNEGVTYSVTDRYEIVRPILTGSERAIFKRWKQNAW